MKSYLQRLAARAEGHALTPSLTPAVNSQMTRESAHDPFAAALESDEPSGAQSPQAVNGLQVTSNDAQVTSTLHYLSETVEPLAARVSSTARSRRVRRSRAGESPEQAIETQPVSPKPEAATRQRAMSSREIDSSATSEGEPRRSRERNRVLAEPAKTQTAQSEEKGSPLLSPVKAGEQPFTRKSEIGAEDVPQQLTRRAEATERSAAASPDAILAHVSFEPAPTLEPRRADAVPPAAPIPDEPRLVIGQLRVDVVAATPTETREVVRVVTRTVGPGRSSNTGGPLSKLRFGLGQM